MSELNKLAGELKKISRQSKEVTNNLGKLVGNITFDYQQQELIRRVFKSVLPKIRSDRDKETAKSILERTRWLDEERA